MNTIIRSKVSPVVTVTAQNYLNAIAKTGYTGMVIYNGRIPELPYRVNNWELTKVKDETEFRSGYSNISTLPGITTSPSKPY